MTDTNFPENNDFLEESELFEDPFAGDALFGDTPEAQPDAADGSYSEDVYFDEGSPAAEFPGSGCAQESAEEDMILPEDMTLPTVSEELTAADSEMYDAGLTHPEDAQFRFGAEDESTDLPQFFPESEPENAPTDDEPVYSDESEPDPAEEQAEPASESGEELPAPRSRRERPVRKGRPKRRKGSGLFSLPQLAAAAVWILIVLAIGVSLGRTIWVCAADVLAFGREEKTVTLSITSDDTMDTIAEKLQKAGLIRYKGLFLFYADLSHAENKITTGTFTLSTIYDYHALVSMMSPRAGNRAVIEDVLIPEGFTCRQIFALLEEKGICKAADLEAWAADGALKDYWFLEDVPRGSKYCLEGYLFPDTYDFYENSTPKQALEKMLDGFAYRVDDDLLPELDALNVHLSEMMRKNGSSEDFIAANQFTLHDLITVASLIEKETAGNEESPKIASVIYNRLFYWGSTPRYLNIDASVIYALEGKTDLTAADMSVDSPYNTYTNTGLTPGPIANPGISSLTAALNPADTNYYYYVLDPEVGEHIYSKTLEEHEKNVDAVRKKANG